MAAQNTSAQKPSMGRIVIYNTEAIGYSDNLGAKATGSQWPALVLQVNADGSLRLEVHGPFAHFGKEGTLLVPGAQLNTAKTPVLGTWQWPALI
jgi:hypothetical protein